MLHLPELLRRGGAVALATVLIAGCFFSPGKFNSTLDVRRDGRFTFTYVGEMHFLALSKMARDMETSAEFTPDPCTDDNGEELPCTRAQLAEQRQAWEAARQDRAESDRREAESMKMFTGNLDMSDPRAGEELAGRLRRQAGWRRAEYRGDGLFDVDFRADGHLDHDFAFPTIENFPLGNAFIQLIRRNDGTVRIDAPGYGPGFGASPGSEMMRGLSGLGGAGGNGDLTKMPLPDGRFILITDAAILANNTDEGPQATASGQQLDWSVNARSMVAPMALLRIAPTAR
jgi:hypothetical protein